MAFDEVRLDTDITYGALGGPVFATDIKILTSGFEARNSRWSQPRRKYDIGYGRITHTRLLELQNFFVARAGKSRGFRFRDLQDWKVTDEPIITDGSPTIQLTRTYTSGAVTAVRNILKPVAGTIIIKVGGTPVGGTSVDTTTGIVTIPQQSTVNISTITNANPGQVTTSVAHGLTTGNAVYITGVVGMTEVNNLAFTITVVDPTNFTIGVNTTNYTPYSSGGAAKTYLHPNETNTWAGEFDVPVRFDVDEIVAQMDAYSDNDVTGAFTLNSIPLVEVRV